MRGSKSFDQPVWTRRFTQPSVDALRGGLSSSLRRVFDTTRRNLLTIQAIREQVVWYGECWHWSIEYRLGAGRDPLAVIILCPTDLQLALPMDREFASGLHVQQMKRTIRDGLELAQAPFDSRWGVWSLASKSMIDDLQDLIDLKISHLANRAI